MLLYLVRHRAAGGTYMSQKIGLWVDPASLCLARRVLPWSWCFSLGNDEDDDGDDVRLNLVWVSYTAEAIVRYFVSVS